MSKNISIIIPCLNEENNINDLLNNFSQCLPDPQKVEVIIIDDGSKKILSDYIKESEYNFSIKVIRNLFTRGQSTSIGIGLTQASSDLIGLIDGDGQNPPHEFVRLYEYFSNNNYDAVISYRKLRKDKLMRKLTSKFANFLLKFLTKSRYKDLGSSLKIIKKKCMEGINFNDGDMHRFIAPILNKRNFNIKQIEVEHLPRTKGKSNYGYSRIIPVVIDGFSFYLSEGFQKPKKYIFGKLAFFVLSISIFLNIFVIFQKLYFDIFVHRNPVFILGVTFLLIFFQLLTMALNEKQ
jgi:glycosyltransferase involved in cell wall biosynthesis